MTTAFGDQMPFEPVLIVGAGRSGTNALRDALVRLEQFATWRCDEINPIWRHGNIAYPTDEIPPDRATAKVRRFIRRAFWRVWEQGGQPRFVLEKTCANTLRLPFVGAILPEARYIHIVRDGYDVVASASKRWRGELEMPGLPYFVAKARYTPVTDLPRYAAAAIRTRLAVWAGLRGRLSTWGPRFAGMDSMLEASADDLAASQWAACVERSGESLGTLGQDQVIHVRYEELARSPASQLAAIVSWLDLEATPSRLAAAAAGIRGNSVGKGRASLPNLSPSVRATFERVMAAQGYSV